MFYVDIVQVIDDALMDRFLAETVYDLRNTLQTEKNSDLLIRFGKLEKVLEQVVKALGKENDTKVVKVLLQKEVSDICQFGGPIC